MELVSNTFYYDFTIADHFGIAAIKDTYNRAFKEWRGNYEMLTALVVILNHKIWENYHAGNEPYAKVYDQLWKEADNYAMEHLKGSDLEYFLEITD